MSQGNFRERLFSNNSVSFIMLMFNVCLFISLYIFTEIHQAGVKW